MIPFKHSPDLWKQITYLCLCLIFPCSSVSVYTSSQVLKPSSRPRWSGRWPKKKRTHACRTKSVLQALEIDEIWAQLTLGLGRADLLYDIWLTVICPVACIFVFRRLTVREMLGTGASSRAVLFDVPKKANPSAFLILVLGEEKKHGLRPEQPKEYKA